MQHLLEATSAQEQPRAAALLGGAGGGGAAAGAPHRANLVQSLYAHACLPDAGPAAWSARVLAAVCALWSRL